MPRPLGPPTLLTAHDYDYDYDGDYDGDGDGDGDGDCDCVGNWTTITGPQPIEPTAGKQAAGCFC